jgi:outer membrane phospholipase A
MVLTTFLFYSALARADITLTTAQPRVSAGQDIALELVIVNDNREPLIFELSSPLHIRLETAAGISIVPFEPEQSGELVVESQAFAKIALRGEIPAEAKGVATLTSTGLEANPLLVEIAPVAQPETKAFQPATAVDADDAERSMPRSALIDKPPPLAVSVYEPIYFLIGGDEGLNAKFQISLRYRLFDGQGKLAERLPWIDDIYLSYSQTSLWDLDDLSKPFRDSSYRPRLFFSNYDLRRFFDGRLRLGVEAGAGHESNGKEGEDSRSFNMLYVRPVLTFGDPEGLRAYAAPLIHNYISDDENPTIDDYRGYVDWVFGIGSKGGLDLSAMLRKGTQSDYGSLELSASYPLSKLSGGDLTGWLMLQYFGGYGESLLDFDQKLDSQLRLGIAIAL